MAKDGRYIPILPLALAAVVCLARPAGADDWPGFRGPERRGVAHETGLLRSWGEEGPRELWRRPLGEGFSGIVVVGEHLFTLFAQDADEYVASFRVEDGVEVWRRRIGERFVTADVGNGPRATPSVADGTIYSLSSYGRLAALDTESGQPLWEVDLAERFGAPQRVPSSLAEVLGTTSEPSYGACSSPLIEGDLLIVPTGAGAGRSLVALDRRTGETRWTALDSGLTYSSPVGVTIAGERQILLLVPDELVALRAATGDVLWRHPWAHIPIAVPVLLPPDRLFLSAPNEVGALMLAIPSDGGGEATELWRERRMRNNWESSLVIDGSIVGFDNSTLKALTADGKLLWAQRGFGRGSVVAADGLLIVLSEWGSLALAEWSPEAFQETGRVEALESPAWTAPSVANGRVFVRNHSEIAGYDLMQSVGPQARMEVEAHPAAPNVQNAEEQTAETFIQSSVEALGGEKAWSAIESLDMICHHSSQGETLPCRVRRKHGSLYRIDYSERNWPRSDVFDGKTAWWTTAMFVISKATWPVRAPDPYPRFFRRNAEIEMPFMRYREKGHTIALVGKSELDNQVFIEIQLHRADGQATERWLFDPGTFLPAVRITEGVYHGYLTEEVTYYTDYREVRVGEDAAVRMPFRIATDVGNDFRELRIDEVKVNVAMDDSIFQLPLPEGMERLRSLAGRFKVRVIHRDDPAYLVESEKRWEENETTSVIHRRYGSTLLEEEIEIPTERWRQVRRLYTWDRFRGIYRIAYFDTFSSHLEVLEGKFDDENRLVTTDLGTNTPIEIYGQPRHVREVLYDLAPDSFRIDREISVDNGATWVPEIHFVYTRTGE